MNKLISFSLLIVSVFGFILFGCKFVFEMLYSGKIAIDFGYIMLMNLAAIYVSLNYILQRWK